VHEFCCILMSSGQLCQGVYRDSPIGDNFTLINVEFSKIGKKLSKKEKFLANNKRFVNIKLFPGLLQQTPQREAH
jgi:hypothetical protein